MRSSELPQIGLASENSVISGSVLIYVQHIDSLLLLKSWVSFEAATFHERRENVFRNVTP